MAATEALKLFFSYSHLDEALRNELGNHLKILEYKKLISSWHDRKILPGEEWDHQISSNLETADIILLLISADFIASRYCWEIEIEQAMKLHEAGQACVIPVILRDVDWTSAPFGKLQALPQNAVAVTSSPNKDAAFKFVAQEIKKTAIAIIEKRKQERERQLKESAITEYRQQYLEFLADGIISPPKQFILKQLQQRLGLTDAEVAAIKTENVANPENLEHYRQVFLETVTQFGYPLNEQARHDLKLLQAYLKLNDGDISQIEASIIAKKEQEQQQQAKPKQQQFQFDFITVNKQGKETSRTRKAVEYFTEDLPNGVLLKMVAIPGGTFFMGTEDDEIERLVKKFNWEGFRREKPQHKVTIKPFFMGKYPVTQAQWRAVCEAVPSASASRTDLKVKRDLNPDPSHFKGDNKPVEQVSWDDAVEFCARLSKLTGQEYRLPSEAEWEYACRSVISYQLSVNSEEVSQNPSYPPFYFGETITSELANYNANYTYADEPKGKYRQETTTVGQFPPNAFGLYDMHGNVWEWCLDNYHDNYQGAPNNGSAWLINNNNFHILRGGSWSYYPGYCRSAHRALNAYPNHYYGFRVVCVPPRTSSPFAL